MRVALSWLREFVDVDLPPKELAERLDLSGTKVEAVHRLGQGIEGVVVAEVLKIDEHPNADNLVLVETKVTEGETFRVVCGAKNFSVGDKVPYAQIGARLPDLQISERKIRGEQSQGMLCSAAELGVSKDHSGILVLPPDSSLNEDVSKLLGLDDVVFELEITSNRPDCMSVIGVAREVAVILGHELKIPEISVATGSDVKAPVSVTIDDSDGCPRYLARYIQGVTIQPSPVWMAARLLAAGMRPISNVVDITNYVLLECGQPLHAFDASFVQDQSIVVRRARRGEKMTTLDEVERALHPDDLMIADPAKALAIAGVMGGGESEVSGSTTDVILESAYFDPDSIAFTARRHQLRTEASARFERGMDPEMVPPAAARAAGLMSELASGAVSDDVKDEYPAPVTRPTIRLRPDRTGAVLGAGLPVDTQRRYLQGLGMAVQDDQGALQVAAPSWRPDLKGEEDLIEEVARIAGFERLPATIPPGKSGGLEREQRFERNLRNLLCSWGIAEAWTSTFMGEWELDQLVLPADHPARRLVRVANPMSEQEDALRSTVLSGLLRSLARNNAAHRNSVALFEIARIFEPGDEEIPVQPVVLAAVFSGDRVEKQWGSSAAPWDFFAAKGVIESFLEASGVDAPVFSTAKGMPFHPTRAAAVDLHGTRLGSIGELHPEVCANFDVPEGTVAFEISLAPVAAALPAREQVEDLPRHPSIYLDVAVVLDETVAEVEVAALINTTGEPELVSVRLFDLYRGEQIPEGKKSLAYALELRVADRTLTDEEANAVRDRIVDRLQQRFDATLRS